MICTTVEMNSSADVSSSSDSMSLFIIGEGDLKCRYVRFVKILTRYMTYCKTVPHQT